jgi:hypothetical protein
MATVLPIPWHSRHMPAGSLNENAPEWPTWGFPTREYSRRSSGEMSVMVPTVEREFPPMRFWSTMMAAERFSIASTSGCP